MKRALKLWMAILLGAGAGCVHTGGIQDVVARVSGRVSADPATQADPNACRLSVYRVGGSGTPIHEAQVALQFEKAFAGPAGSYYFTLSCSALTGEFRSQPYEIRDMRYRRAPIDLGNIQLR